MTSRWTTRPVTSAEAAILHHPDRRSAWVPGVRITVDGAPLDLDVVQQRLVDLAGAHSILGARLAGGSWVAGAGAPQAVVTDDPWPLLRGHFELAREAPLRAALSPDGTNLTLACHHAALDGRALIMVARALLGDAWRDEPVASASPAPSLPGSAWASTAPPSALSGAGPRSALRRLVRPADPVAASPMAPDDEVFVAADLPPAAPARVASLAAAATAAVADWNARCGAPWRRVGLTIPVGGPPVLGNVSTHHRLDLAAGADAHAAVSAALRRGTPAPDAAPPAALARRLGPLVGRLSDSLLISNLGLLALPGASAVDFFPVARGRSAVAFGAASVTGGARRLTVRARNLPVDDAQWLLDATITRLIPRAHGA